MLKTQVNIATSDYITLSIQNKSFVLSIREALRLKFQLEDVVLEIYDSLQPVALRKLLIRDSR